METLLLDGLKTLLTVSPGYALILYMWWSEREERRKVQLDVVAKEKEIREIEKAYSNKYAERLEQNIKGDFEASAAINKMTTFFEAQLRQVAQR